MKLDFLLCGSVTPGFLSQFAFFRLCLDALGGHYRDARLVALLGDHTEASIPEEWVPYLERIEIVWAHEPGAENIVHSAQHYRRFDVLRDGADLCFICDADVAPLAAFDDLITELVQTPALAGVMAHYPFPMPNRQSREPEKDWQEIAEDVLGYRLDLDHRFLLAPHQPTPFYINYGVFVGTPSMLKCFAARDRELFEPVARHVTHWWASQVSLALTCIDLALPTRELVPRFNYPNYELCDELFPDEMADIRLMHYLGLKAFDRQKIFCQPAAFDALMTADLTGSNAVFQSRVEAITSGVFPFPDAVR
ncbi:hypothetical protein [Maricaulis sp.]|uniref:hypothetical protein n=1 Tax=Maricaulis sp. TaxID=1486257 RepID=UPI00260ADCD3|nr:hypothetical protein [Maricaulis sp.]